MTVRRAVGGLLLAFLAGVLAGLAAVSLWAAHVYDEYARR